ncbi:MAG: choice-of-anchor B family protein, partial [Actinomycetota bacterium]|nr:choice-of-anchor B family protein [Actinomycetota bacterium]
PRLAIFVAVLLAAVGALTVTVGASSPDAGTVSLDQPTTGWTGERYALGVPVPGGTIARAACLPGVNALCDEFSLTVDIDPGHWSSNLGGVEIGIVPEGDDDDFDLYVYRGASLVASSATAGPTAEKVFIDDAAGEYEVRVVPWDVTDSGYTGGVRVESRPKTTGDVPTKPISNAPCENGVAAGAFPCKGIDLAGFLPLDGLGGASPVALNPEENSGQLNDIWGWTDPATRREYALVGKTNGTAFVDVSDPAKPLFLGELPSHQGVAGVPVETLFNIWRDVKVYRDHAFIVAEEPTHGMQVFDLKQLRGADAAEPETFKETAHYSYVLDGFGSVLEPSERLNTLDNAHNIAINEESGVAYAVGTSTCNGGGLHMIDISQPADPKFLGCVLEEGSPTDESYVHDAQCVTYDGPDLRYSGREICFDSNEDSLTIVDVTDLATGTGEPRQLSRTEYEDSAYTHQGWLTEDGRHFLVDDELDERETEGVDRTQTYIFNVENLENVKLVKAHEGVTGAIDHNLYVRGNRAFQANYRSGLRVLDTGRAAEGLLPEVGFFDVFPENDKPEFNGAWSNYPYFASGTVVVSGIEQGLFVLRPDAHVAGSAGPGQAEAKRCAAAASRARPARIGSAGLGRRRGAVRRSFGSRGAYRRFMDRFCLSDGSAIRVGYPTQKALRALPRPQRRRLRGRANLVLTSSTRTKLRGVRVGMGRARLLQRIGNRRGVRVGRNVWYLRRGSRARQVFRVRGGRLREVGLADRELTGNRASARRLLKSGR